MRKQKDLSSPISNETFRKSTAQYLLLKLVDTYIKLIIRTITTKPCQRNVIDINKYHFKAGSGELASIHIYRGHYCVWSVRLFFPSLICSYWAWGNMASHAYNNPISVSHIPNLLPPFFPLWCTHRNCPLFHCPLKIEAPTLHVIHVHI